MSGNGTQTIGQQRVRASFNPSASSDVDKVKEAAANLIDACEALKGLDPRLASLAMTAYEEAAMWHVKLVTTPQS